MSAMHRELGKIFQQQKLMVRDTDEFLGLSSFLMLLRRAFVALDGRPMVICAVGVFLV
jgi:hypothetical protein